MSSKQTRIFLWTAPRCLSTAFARAMSNRRSIEVMLAPYEEAYYFGSERISRRFKSKPTKDNCTFKDIKALCEEPYSEKEEIFVKDMAYYLIARRDFPNLLPDGYTHVFLIRHPKKSIASHYNVSLTTDHPEWKGFDPHEAGFKELHRIFRFITEEMGQEAIVVDADDLVAEPYSILQAFCTKVGIDFQENMVKWKHPPDNIEELKMHLPWTQNVLESKTFDSGICNPSNQMSISELPEYVKKLITECMPYYEYMYEMRLKLRE